MVYEAPRPSQSSGESAPAFVVDKRGDPLILRYGTNDRSRVPNYRRFGSGKVLGLQETISTSREGTKEVFFIKPHRDGGSVFREKNRLLQTAARSKGKPVRPKARDKTSDAAKDAEEFVPLSTSHKRKRSVSDGSSSDDNEKELSYRSIMGKAKQHEHSDSDVESDNDSSADGGELPFKDDPIKRKSMELSRQVKEHPEDLGSWLELVEVQDDLFSRENGAPATTGDEVRALASMKASLLESALPHAKTVVERERLLVRLMREGLKSWTPAQLAKRWQTVAETNIDSFELWKSHLDFEMTNMSGFSLEGVKSFCLERLRFLKGQLPRLVSTEESVVTLCRQLLYVFLRTTLFLHDSGFTALAVAAWQAQMELAFSRPQALAGVSADTLLAELRDFWESEVPRIGEDGAKGWRHFVETAGGGDPPDAGQRRQTEPPKTRDAYKAWAAMEQQRSASSQMPARTLDEGSEDDPFGVVMFSDIEELLFVLPPSATSLVRSQLIDSFLLFSGLPTAFGSSDWIQSARNDPFVARDGLALGSSELSDPGVQEALSPRKPPFHYESSQMCPSADVLFGGSNWFSYFSPSLKALDDPVRLWAFTTTKQLVRSFAIEELAEYSLAVEWLRDPGSAKKAARSLLKMFPSRLPLYNAYAVAERVNGNADVARKVLLSATGLKLGPGSEDNMSLWQTWAWTELEVGNKERAIARLCSSIEEHSGAPIGEGEDMSFPPPAQLLKTRQRLHTSRDYQLSSGNLASSGLYAQSLCLFEYLTAQGGSEPRSADQGNISAAMASVLSFSEELSNRGLEASAVHEFILQFTSRLLYFHTTRG